MYNHLLMPVFLIISFWYSPEIFQLLIFPFSLDMAAEGNSMNMPYVLPNCMTWLTLLL